MPTSKPPRRLRQRTNIAATLSAAALILAIYGAASPVHAAPPTVTPAISWAQSLRQPPGFYKSVDAVRVADNLLLYQFGNGGWEKNLDMAAPLTGLQRTALPGRSKSGETTIDNGATVSQLLYLARVYDATGTERFRTAFVRGLDFLLAAQYPNGGWPQFYPLRKGYYTHITFNDNAMIGVMTLLREIARKKAPYAFIDDLRAMRAGNAVERGTECILRCQVIVGGKRTAWCAQHDERTFAPAPARAYELVSLSGSESVGITRFLMEIESPPPSVVRAVEAAVAWFESAKLTGIRVAEKPDSRAPKGRDRVVVRDPAAPPLWARFYEIGTNLPIYCDRDGVPKRKLSEIGYERRNGYAWLGDWPRKLLETDYPAWRKRTAKP